MFELRWLVTDSEKILQYRYKYQTVAFSYNGGYLPHTERVELVWSEWKPVQEVEAKNAT